MRIDVNDLLAIKHGILVHGCNAQGKMGSGVAESIKSHYPQAFATYQKAYQTNGLPLGSVWPCVIKGSPDRPELIVVNAITQKFYGRDPNVKYVSDQAVQEAFEAVAILAQRYQLPVYYPLIGCGLANGKWEEIGPLIERTLNAKNVEHTLVVQTAYDARQAEQALARESASARSLPATIDIASRKKPRFS